MSKRLSIFLLMLAGLTLLASPAEDSRNLKKAMSKVDLGGEFLNVQVTPRGYQEFLKALPTTANGNMDLLSGVIVRAIYRISGSHLIKSGAASSKEVAPGCWVFKSYLYTGKENMLLPSIFSAFPAKSKQLDIAQLPGDTILAFSFDADGETLYNVIINELKSSPELAQIIGNFEMLAEQKGINISKCMTSMNGNFKFVVAGSSPNNFRISLTIPDKNGTLGAVIRRMLNLPADTTQTQIPAFFIPVKLNMAAGKVSLQTAAPAPANAGVLGNDPTFRNYISRTGSAGNGYFLMNGHSQIVQTARAMMPPQVKAVVDLKPFSMLGIFQRQPEGIYSVAAADFSLTSAAGKGVIAMFGGIMLPALNAARERARMAVCVSNLKQIGLALMMYAQDNNEKYPAPNGHRGLQLLIDKEYLTDMKAFSCPSSPILYPPAKLTSACPYIYIGGALDSAAKIKNPPAVPVVFEKPGNHKKHAIVLFADGHVETLVIPGGKYTDPAQVIGLLSKRADFSPEMLNKLLHAVVENQ